MSEISPKKIKVACEDHLIEDWLIISLAHSTLQSMSLDLSQSPIDPEAIGLLFAHFSWRAARVLRAAKTNSTTDATKPTSHRMK
jgi:hypothetical protein